jgi:Zn ribbon nucleic-acid-binding protein
METAKKHCPQCETKYTIQWNLDEQDLEPYTCPFCGYEVNEDIDEDNEKVFEQAEDDSWN